MKKKLFALFLALSLSLSLAACMKQPVESDADLGAFYTSLLEDGEWPEMVSMEDEALNSFYPGLLDVEMEQCSVSSAAISAVACEIALVEVKNTEDVKTVEDIFQARVDYQVGDGNGPGGAFYPETMDTWENNSRIVSNGNYVMLAVCEDADGAVDAFNALFA